MKYINNVRYYNGIEKRMDVSKKRRITILSICVATVMAVGGGYHLSKAFSYDFKHINEPTAINEIAMSFCGQPYNCLLDYEHASKMLSDFVDNNYDGYIVDDVSSFVNFLDLVFTGNINDGLHNRKLSDGHILSIDSYFKNSDEFELVSLFTNMNNEIVQKIRDDDKVGITNLKQKMFELYKKNKSQIFSLSPLSQTIILKIVKPIILSCDVNDEFLLNENNAYMSIAITRLKENAISKNK